METLTLLLLQRPELAAIISYFYCLSDYTFEND